MSDTTTEKDRRIYYQNIVYYVCGKLDQAFGKSVCRGTGTVCGTADKPSSEVQDSMRRLLLELQMLRRQPAGLCSYCATQWAIAKMDIDHKMEAGDG